MKSRLGPSLLFEDGRKGGVSGSCSDVLVTSEETGRSYPAFPPGAPAVCCAAVAMEIVEHNTNQTLDLKTSIYSLKYITKGMPGPSQFRLPASVPSAASASLSSVSRPSAYSRLLHTSTSQAASASAALQTTTHSRPISAQFLANTLINKPASVRTAKMSTMQAYHGHNEAWYVMRLFLSHPESHH